MKSVLPGKPEPRLQALATAYWDSRRITAYISGSAFIVLRSPDALIQTVYDDDGCPLEAITIDEASGKIAVCTDRVVRIYRPIGKEEDLLRWALQSSFEIAREKGAGRQPAAISLSWGSSEELLVGHAALELYQTSSTPQCSWRKSLANPVKIASLSYDSAYIASVAEHEKLVKVWRRLSYGPDDVRFDFIYLVHPQPVTDIQWRLPHHVDQTIDNVLYTFCADHHLRVWTGSDSHGQQMPSLWGKLDLDTALQSGKAAHATPGKASLRLAFMLHGRDFSVAIEKAVQASSSMKKSQKGPDRAALERLIAVANRSPETCLIFDGHGGMAAWALENVGCKSKKSNIFEIAHVASKDFLFLQNLADEKAHIEGQVYCSSEGHLEVLIHSFDGKVDVFRSNIIELFDSGPRGHRLVHQCTWSGHSAPIMKIVRNFSGRAIVSRTEGGESIVWRHTLGSHRIGLKPQGLIKLDGQIHRMCVLRKGRFVVFLQEKKIALWDYRYTTPCLLAESQYALAGKPLCLLILPRHKVQDYMTAHIATINSDNKGVVWEINLPNYSPKDAGEKKLSNGHTNPSIRELVRFELPGADDLAYVLPVDPAGSAVAVSGFLDVFAKDVAISYTHSGRVDFWTARVDRDRGRVEWLSTSSMETGIASPSLASGSTMKKAALVNKSRSTLTIWDIRSAQLEYTQDFENHQNIRDIDWTSTPDSQSILAVGFPHRVLLLSQMRFDYLNKGPAWAAVREISIRDLTPHPIGDSTWLGDGHLVIGAGNQLFVHDRQFDVSSSLITSLRLPHRKDGKWDLFEVVQRLNGPLPVFHPQFLSQCLLAGKLLLVHRVLLALHRTLKFWIEGEPIDDYLGLNIEDFYASPSSTESRHLDYGAGAYLSRRGSYDDTEETFSEDVAAAICEKLTKVGLVKLSGHEQIQLLDMVECVGLVEKQRRSLDDNGARFMLFFRQYALRKRRTNESHMSWREINWAYHSTSQDILVDFVSKQHHGALLWEHARESGMFMWLTDSAAVKAQFEIIARNEYTKSEMKNPVDCSLFYLALRKKTVLQGLWRMATWNREQSMTQKLLSNNFQEPKWKTAALKNAYALMSKRRFEYAAAFFLLADHLQDAVNVCLSQLKDMQLAIAIARVYEGDNGPVLRQILEEEVLKVAAREGNRWLASWAFWMLHRRDMAVRALITPVYNVVETPGPTDLSSRLFLTDDPALIILYYQLRQQSLQTLRGVSKVTPKVEWEFVLHNARLYDRMGCDLLGLDLVRNWEFLKSNVNIRPGLEGEMDTLKLLRRRSSLVVADLPMLPTSPVAAKMPPDMKSGGRQQPPPVVFQEPDANSLLDSFGF